MLFMSVQSQYPSTNDALESQIVLNKFNVHFLILQVSVEVLHQKSHVAKGSHFTSTSCVAKFYHCHTNFKKCIQVSLEEMNYYCNGIMI